MKYTADRKNAIETITGFIVWVKYEVCRLLDHIGRLQALSAAFYIEYQRGEK